MLTSEQMLAKCDFMNDMEKFADRYLAAETDVEKDRLVEGIEGRDMDFVNQVDDIQRKAKLDPITDRHQSARMAYAGARGSR